MRDDVLTGTLLSPIGKIIVQASGKGVTYIGFADDDTSSDLSDPTSDIIDEALRQLDEYFAGSRKIFDIPLDLKGTDFQLACWKALLDIPYGKTSSYGEIASATGHPRAARAVGGANNKNPISIVVPCHRVIGANGKLVGYGGGMWRKEWLLEHERKRCLS